MSQLKVNSIVDANGGSNAVLYGVASPVGGMGFRNKILNGDMRIDQRNAGASVTPANGQYLTDRWVYSAYQASKITAQQSTVAPAGFTHSLLITSTSAYTVGAGEYFTLQQRIEGFNVADFGFGAAGAQTVTLSFWVRSSLTGTFGGSLNSDGLVRSYPFSFTISAANTWEQKTVTVTGDTTGTWAKNNTNGMYVLFSLGSGSTFSAAAGSWSSAAYTAPTGATSVVGTNGATFYLTGVQLEAGSVASPFERVEYGAMLRACQRYFQYVIDARQNIAASVIASCYSATLALANHRLLVSMRAAPTMTSTAAAGFAVVGNGTASTASAITLSNAGTDYARIDVTGSAMLSGGSCIVAANVGNSTPNIALSAEL